MAEQRERPIRWVRAASAAEYLGIGRSSLYRMVDDGRLPAEVRRRLGPGVVLWDLEALDRVVEGASA